MLALIIFGFILSGFSAHAFLICKKGDEAVVSRARSLYETVEKLYKAKAVREAELLRARLFIYEAELCSENWTTTEFCQRSMSLIKKITTPEELKLGASSMQERRERIQLLADGNSVCGAD
jgi:hypothetical protein